MFHFTFVFIIISSFFRFFAMHYHTLVRSCDFLLCSSLKYIEMVNMKRTLWQMRCQNFLWIEYILFGLNQSVVNGFPGFFEIHSSIAGWFCSYFPRLLTFSRTISNEVRKSKCASSTLKLMIEFCWMNTASKQGKM